MTLEEFKKDLLEEVKATAATAGDGSSAAFASVISNYLVNAEVLSDFYPAFYLGNGKNNRKLRVDGYVLDEFDLTLNLIITDYSGDEGREVVTKTAASSLFDRLFYFLEEAYESRLYNTLEPSTPAYDLIEQLRYNKERIRKYRLLLLTDGLMSTRIYEIDQKNLNGIPIESQIWDIERVYRVCLSDSGRQDIEVNFKEYNNGYGFPCLEASVTNSYDYRSYLCVIPGSVLADIYEKYGAQLLEGNVRSFLSTKVAVNKKIRETILRSPQNFFAYNNGVSATAVDLKIESTQEGMFVTYAKDFQIINGGQTTASLSNARFRDKADLSQIYVQMKLTKVDSDLDRSTELIRNISRSSNSQNKVSDADFFATHPFHIRIEQLSRRVYAPATGGVQYDTKWFYERARGQYLQEQMHLTKSTKEKFLAQNPKNQVITKTDLAKYRNSWDGLPHVVSKGAQTNFIKFAESTDESWSKSDAGFNEKYFKDTVALALLFKHTENLVSHQPWYEQGYRANIVTYSISLFRKLVEKQFPGKELDLQIIWNRQQIPDSISCELVKITKFVFESITAPDRGTINVTQWCKRDACWDRVKNCDITLSNELYNLLISKGEKKAVEKEAKKEQAFISEIEAQSKVLELGSDFWSTVHVFVLNRDISISPDQLTALKIALKIPNKLPNSTQSYKLLSLLEDVRSHGFKG